MQMELEEQPPVAEQEQVDEQVQDAANVGYQEGLLPEEDTVEHQWRLGDKVMVAFNGIFNGYEQINKGFRALSQLIDGTPLHLWGKSSMTYKNWQQMRWGMVRGRREVMVVQRRGENLVGKWEGVGRRVGRGPRGRRVGMGTMTTMTMTRTKDAKLENGNRTLKSERQLMYRQTHLWHKNLDHHMT